LRRRPSAIKRSWYRLTGRNPYAPDTASGEKLTFQDIRKNYKAYRKEKRVYLAQKKFHKQKEKERRKKERRNNQDNPFYQILFSNEWKRKVAVDQDGNILYTPSIANSIIHILNSLASFLVAYLIIYLLYQLVVLITASFYDIDSVLYYYKLEFNNHSRLWDRLNIIIITLSGPANSLFLGFFFYNYLYFKAKSFPRLQLFYLWAGLLAFAHFFAAFIAGVVTNKGFGYVPLWLFWNDFTKFFFTFIALVSLALIGYYSASRFQSTSNNMFRIQKQNRALFYLHQVFIPFIIGFAITYVVKLPNNVAYDTLILAFSTIMFGAVFFHINAKPHPFSKPQNSQANLNWILILLALVSLYFFRVYLAEGLHFIIKFSMSITPAGKGI
jgi:hypothetical protein